MAPVWHLVNRRTATVVCPDSPRRGRLQSPNNTSAQIILAPPGFDTPQPNLGVDLGDPSAVDAAHDAATRQGMRVVRPPVDEPWGVRRFFVEDPGGTIVNVLAHKD